MEKVASKFRCDICDYSCSNKTNFNKHLSTRKHQMMTNDDAKVALSSFPTPCQKNEYKFVCNCGNRYKHRQGLFVHKKSCFFEENPGGPSINMDVSKNTGVTNVSENEPPTPQTSVDFLQAMLKELMVQNKEMKMQTKELQETMIKENNEFKNFILENNNRVINNNTVNACVNNINKFNLNVFLNEECKNAINITDYVDNMELQLEDLEQTAKLGYADGIAKIINDRMRETGIKQRPFHCTDGKREIVYVRDNNVWERENSDKPRMRRMITSVIHKNLQQLYKWHKKYPECSDTLNDKSSEYLNIMIEANGGNICEREKKEEQILKNILKEAFIGNTVEKK
jgi:hypothetical protein